MDAAHNVNNAAEVKECVGKLIYLQGPRQAMCRYRISCV